MRQFIVARVALVVLLGGSVCWAEGPARPESWARPVVVEGVPNLFQVSEGLYRSAQPSTEGMRRLKEMGVVTIVNLRSFHSDRDEIALTGLAYEHIYMKPWHLERKEAVRFLQIAMDSRRTPVLVHCRHGADRTGAMIAVYRIAVEGWPKEVAIREMRQGGYGFHEVWINIPFWIRELNIESICRDAGIAPARIRPPEPVLASKPGG